MQRLVHRTRRLGGANELLVAYRFVMACRIPAFPVVPMPYDLLVDCGDSVQRVQVRTAHNREGQSYTARLTKRHAKGDRPIPVKSFDYLCLVCEPNEIFVVPAVSLASPSDPTVLCARLQFSTANPKWWPYRNACAIGAGYGEVGDVSAEFVSDVPPISSPWYPERKVPSPRREGTRKRHTYLTTEAVQEILRLPIGHGPGMISADTVAAKYGVTRTTIHNYLRRSRSDLRLLPTDTLANESKLE